MKIIHDEFNDLCALNNFNSLVFGSKVRNCAIRNSGLKNLSVIMRTSIQSIAEDFTKLIDKFSQYYEIKDDVPISVKYEKMIDKIDEFRSEVDYASVPNDPKVQKTCDIAYSKRYDGFSNVVSNLARTIRSILRNIDSTISFVNASYGIENKNDPRYSATTTKELSTARFSVPEQYYDHNLNWWEIDKIEQGLKDKGTDIFAPEYGKVICKKLRAFKNDVISTVNKYLGKGSIFEDFNMIDLVL